MDPQHLIFGVQQQDPQVFLLQGGHLRLQQVGHILGGVDDRPVLRSQGDKAAAQLQRRHQLAGFGFAEAALGAQFGKGGAAQAVQPPETGQQAVGHRQHILPGNAGAEQDGNKFGVAQVARAVVPQPLPGPFPLRHIPQLGLIVVLRRPGRNSRVNRHSNFQGVNALNFRRNGNNHKLIPSTAALAAVMLM